MLGIVSATRESRIDSVYLRKGFQEQPVGIGMSMQVISTDDPFGQNCRNAFRDPVGRTGDSGTASDGRLISPKVIGISEHSRESSVSGPTYVREQ